MIGRPKKLLKVGQFLRVLVCFCSVFVCFGAFLVGFGVNIGKLRTDRAAFMG